MTRLERGLHPHPNPLDRERRDDGLKFRWERFGKIARELAPLFKEHWRELALDHDIIPLDPDWEGYAALDLMNRLHVLTARHQRDLVGYVFDIIGPHMHYVSTRTCHTDMFWLAPEHRQGWSGVAFMLENIRGLRERGVVVHTICFKLHFMNGRVGKLLNRLGYTASDIVMKQVL